MVFRATALALAAALTACSDSGSTAGDAGLSDTGADATHQLTEIRVQGRVNLEFGLGSPATGVAVTARCGGQTVEATTDQEGRYDLTAPVAGCDPLVLEFSKESYLPNYRVIHLPPPTSPVTLDVPLTALGKIECGSYRCIVGGDDRWEMQNDPIRQGWAVTMTGQSALDFLPGEFRQPDGRLIAFVGLSFFDFRDANGAQLNDIVFPPKDCDGLCMPVPDEALDWLGDVDPATDEVEMLWYKLDKSSGRWVPSDRRAQVRYNRPPCLQKKDDFGICTCQLDAEDRPYDDRQNLLRGQLADVRAKQLIVEDVCQVDAEGDPLRHRVTEYFVCGPINDSGWYAWGLAVTDRTCLSLSAVDQCGTPLSNVVFNLKGRDQGFRAQAWTDREGKACLDVPPSEPEGLDFDYDGLGGETFWLDVELHWSAGAVKKLRDHECPRQSDTQASCSDPTACVPLQQIFEDPTGNCPGGGS